MLHCLWPKAAALKITIVVESTFQIPWIPEWWPKHRIYSTSRGIVVARDLNIWCLSMRWAEDIERKVISYARHSRRRTLCHSHLRILARIAGLYCFANQQICKSIFQIPDFFSRYGITLVKWWLAHGFLRFSWLASCIAARIGSKPAFFSFNWTSVSEDCSSTKIVGTWTDRLDIIRS